VIVTVWPALSVPDHVTVEKLTTVQVPTLAEQLPASARKVGVKVAVKFADCGVALGLVTVAVTDTLLPGPVQASGSSMCAVTAGAMPWMVSV